jgi:hypothetical protein
MTLLITIVAFLVILVVFGATLPFLDQTGRASLLVAAAITVPTNPRPITTTISRPASRSDFTRLRRYSSSRRDSSGEGSEGIVADSSIRNTI